GALILSEPRAIRSRVLPTRREAPAVAQSIPPTSHVCVLVALHLAGVGGFAGSTGVVSGDWRSHRAAAKADARQRSEQKSTQGRTEHPSRITRRALRATLPVSVVWP